SPCDAAKARPRTPQALTQSARLRSPHGLRLVLLDAQPCVLPDLAGLATGRGRVLDLQRLLHQPVENRLRVALDRDDLDVVVGTVLAAPDRIARFRHDTLI